MDARPRNWPRWKWGSISSRQTATRIRVHQYREIRSGRSLRETFLMNPGFSEFLNAKPEDRRDVFLGTARRLGTPEQNVEKDFWVTWTLDVLFNGLPAGHPRFLFKGGTSLSKAYGLISRFSEDIDITVFREDLGQAASVQELTNMSRKKREARIDA